jgi:hypothetical protein
MNKVKNVFALFLINFVIFGIKPENVQVENSQIQASQETIIFQNLEKSAQNEDDKTLFGKIKNQEVDLDVILQALQEKDKYSVNFLNQLKDSLTKILEPNFWPMFLNLAVANNLSLNSIKSIIDLSSYLSPDIVGMLSFKKKSEPVYKMKLFAYFVAIMAQNSRMPYRDWESEIINLWNTKKTYINEVFDYIASCELFKKSELFLAEE